MFYIRSGYGRPFTVATSTAVTRVNLKIDVPSGKVLWLRIYNLDDTNDVQVFFSAAEAARVGSTRYVTAIAGGPPIEGPFESDSVYLVATGGTPSVDILASVSD